MYRYITHTISLILLISFVVIFANVSYAFKERAEKQGIEALEFRADELYISQSNTSFGQLASQLRNTTALQLLLEKYPGFIYIDPRSGVIYKDKTSR